jgi:hypothetical protein
MYLTPDYRDRIELFNLHKVKYLLVGAHAMSVFGYARSTYDIDIWVGKSTKNARRIIEALDEFGLPFSLEIENLTAANKVIQIGIAPNRIDILTDIDGVDFDEAWSRRKEVRIEAMTVNVLAAEDLIANKLASNRPKDRLDVDELQAALNEMKKDSGN